MWFKKKEVKEEVEEEVEVNINELRKYWKLIDINDIGEVCLYKTKKQNDEFIFTEKLNDYPLIRKSILNYIKNVCYDNMIKSFEYDDFSLDFIDIINDEYYNSGTEQFYLEQIKYLDIRLQSINEVNSDGVLDEGIDILINERKEYLNKLGEIYKSENEIILFFKNNKQN